MRVSPTAKPENRMGCWSAVSKKHPWKDEDLTCGYDKCEVDHKCVGCTQNTSKGGAVLTELSVPGDILRVQKTWARRWRLE